MPEMPADAPIIGASAPACASRYASAPAATVAAKNNKKAQRAEPARHRAGEGEQPHRVEAEMHPVGMQQRVGEEAPDLGARAAGQNAVGERACVVARRHERQASTPARGRRRPCSSHSRTAWTRPSTASNTTTTRGNVEDRFAPLVQLLVQESSSTRIDSSLRESVSVSETGRPIKQRKGRAFEPSPLVTSPTPLGFDAATLRRRRHCCQRRAGFNANARRPAANAAAAPPRHSALLRPAQTRRRTATVSRSGTCRCAKRGTGGTK